MVAHTIILLVAGFISVAHATFINELHALVTRQTSSGASTGIDPSLIPPQCKNTCLPINDLSDGSCTTVQCICGTRISGAMSGCLQCALDASGLASFIPQCQTIYDNYADVCKTSGMPVSSFTFKLDNNAGPSGTSGGSGGATSSESSGTTNPTGSPGSGSSNSNGSGTDTNPGVTGKLNGASQLHIAMAGLIGAFGAAVFLTA